MTVRLCDSGIYSTRPTPAPHDVLTPARRVTPPGSRQAMLRPGGVNANPLYVAVDHVGAGQF